jgi:FkbM family methyltransferase
MIQKFRTIGKAVKNLGPLQAAAFFWHRFRVRVFDPQNTFSLHSKYAHYPLWCRPGSSDLDVFWQIFVCREYRCLDLVVDPQFIVDCGANVGYASAYFLSRYPAAQVVSIEPDPENFAMLQQNIAPYSSRASALQTGIWSKKTGLVISEEPFGDNREWARTVREVRKNEAATLTAVDIGSLLDNSGFDRISILKIDIEGSEKEVFSSNFRQWIGRVDTIVIELHGDACREAFMQAISEEDFAISSCDELTVCVRTHPNDARTASGNRSGLPETDTSTTTTSASHSRLPSRSTC